MLEIFIDKNYMEGKYKIYIFDEEKQEYFLPCNLEIMKVMKEDEGKYRSPTFEFNWGQGEEFLKALTQALIDCGFRDKAFDKDREIKRINDHLQDIRKIVFKKLGIEELKNEK